MLFDHVPDAYILADMQGEIIDCNQATEELAGYGREELVGNNFACLPWLDFRQQVRLADLLAQTARGEVMGPVDFNLTRKDGGEVIAEGMSLPLYIQGQNLVLTIVRDITARKQAEAALRESEARFRHISSTISDISYSCTAGPDGSYAIDWLAGAVERITGYSVEEIKAQGCWKFLVIEADQPLFEKHITGLAAGSSGTCELRLRHKNGGIVWVASFAKIVQEPEQPELLSLYGGLVDITARKQAEEALRRAKRAIAPCSSLPRRHHRDGSGDELHHGEPARVGDLGARQPGSGHVQARHRIHCAGGPAPGHGGHGSIA